MYRKKKNGEINIILYFTQYVVYSSKQKVEKEIKGMTTPMKKITWCLIYLIKVNYTSYIFLNTEHCNQY